MLSLLKMYMKTGASLCTCWLALKRERYKNSYLKRDRDFWSKKKPKQHIWDVTILKLKKIGKNQNWDSLFSWFDRKYSGSQFSFFSNLILLKTHATSLKKREWGVVLYGAINFLKLSFYYVSVLGSVRWLRCQNPALICSPEQYHFIYELVNQG